MRGGMRGRKQNLRRERERACQPTAVTIIHHHKHSGKHMHAHAHTHTRMHAYTLAIGRFSEDGLHKYMPFVIFRARSHERSQCHFQADF